MDRLLNLIAAAAIIITTYMLINEASAYDSTPDQVVTMPVVENPSVYTECNRRFINIDRVSFVDVCRFTPDGDWYLISSRGGVERLGRLVVTMEDAVNQL